MSAADTERQRLNRNDRSLRRDFPFWFGAIDTARRNPIHVLALICLGAGLMLVGCASAGENPARARLDDVYREQYEPFRKLEAQRPDLGESATLGLVIALAESRNPGLRAAFERWLAALEKVPQAKSLPDPKLSYAYFIESVETRVGPQRQKFGISQTIPLFGKRGLRGDVALHEAEVAGADFEAARLDLRFRLARLWNDYYYLGRAVSSTEESLRLLTYFESVVLSRYASGQASHSAVIRAQVELGRLEDRLRTLRDQRAPLLAAMNAELNREPNAPIAWPDSIDEGPLPFSQEELREALLEKSPQLAALRSRTEREATATRLAGKSPIPDLTIGAEYIDTDRARFPGVLESGKNAAIVAATVNVPLWVGRYRGEKAQAEARHSAAQNDQTQAQNRLLADLERAHFEFRDAERKADLYAGTLLPKARQSLQVTEKAFTGGEADFLDLVDAQRTLLEFELSYERAVADRASGRRKIEQIVGIELGAGDAGGGLEP